MSTEASEAREWTLHGMAESAGFTAAPALVGAAYGDNEDVAKMFARAQTGGGFVPFTFVRDGAVVRVLFYVEMDNAGGVRGRGKVQV